MRKYLSINPTNRVTSEQLRFERGKIQKANRLNHLHQMTMQITEFINMFVLVDIEYTKHWVGSMLPHATWTPYHSTVVVECGQDDFKLKVVYSYVDPKAPTIYLEVLSKTNRVLSYTATYEANAVYNVMSQRMRQDIIDMFDAVFDVVFELEDAEVSA